jgi:hypothetical protein
MEEIGYILAPELDETLWVCRIGGPHSDDAEN